MAATLVKVCTKLTIGVGAVYLTLDQGVWSSSNHSDTLLQQFKTKVVPTTDEYLKQIPSIRDIKDKTVDTWNYGVHKAFGGMASTPDVVNDYSRKAVDEIKKNFK